MFHQYIKILKSRPILVRHEHESGSGESRRTYTTYEPPKFAMHESNFSEASPDFVCFFITEILPGNMHLKRAKFEKLLRKTEEY